MKDAMRRDTNPALVLSPEERRMLEVHRSSRPASGYDNKKVARGKKKNRFYKKPEFYAAFLAIFGIVAVLAIGILAAGVSQATDINNFIEFTQDEGTQSLADIGGVDSRWFEFVVLIQSNLVPIMLGVVGFFLLCAATILVFANIYRSSKSRTQNNEASNKIDTTTTN